MFGQISVEAVLIDDESLEMEIALEEEALVDFDESEETELASAGEAPEPEASPATYLAPDVESSRFESSPQPKPAIVARAKKMGRPIQKGEERRILRDVKLHFRTKDWEGAVRLIERLVKISPSKGTYRGMLARAMSRHPVMRKDAEPHFVAALRLAPQDPELHFWLGLYYQSFGLKSRAVTEFRATLHIAPRHEGARKQLSGEKKADSLSALVKRIFE
jgi:tetratricopeptide (TPR) repeat protein